MTVGDIPPPESDSEVPEAVGALRRGVAAAESDHGRGHPKAAELRARLTRVLIEFGRDAEAASIEAGTLRGVVKGETGSE